MEPKQPLINHKLVVRSGILMIALLVLFFGYAWLRNRGADIDLGAADTKYWFAALEYTQGSGSQAVVIKPDGTVLRSPGYKPGAHDRDVVWRPDGNRIFFSSDRSDEGFNIYRWNLATGVVEKRTLGKLSKSNPSFPSAAAAVGAKNPLMVYSGMAWELDPGEGKAIQLVPPKEGKDSAQVDTRDESSSEKVGGFGEGAAYKVREARYFAGKDWVAVIRRTDEGDRLIVQSMLDPQRHLALTAGDKVFIDVDPKSGKLFYSSIAFQWPDPNNIPPQFVINGAAKKPFVHYVSIFDPVTPDANNLPVIATQKDDACFSNIALSPDGATLACTVGAYKGGGEFVARAILAMPAQPSGVQQSATIFPTANAPKNLQITNLSWSPDGRHVAFGVIDKAGDREICVVDKDGGGFKEVTKGKGKFGMPKYSPQ